METRKKVRFTIKLQLLLGLVGVALIPAIILAFISHTSEEKIILKMVEEHLNGVTENLLNICSTCYEMNQRTINNNLNVATHFVEGKVELSSEDPLKWTVENQVTRETLTKSIPKMLIKKYVVSGDTMLVDKITQMVGGAVTIFQVMQNPNGLLRISTSVKKKDGTRGIGTFIPDNSPVYKSIVNGRFFRGVAYVVDDWYISAYKPLFDSDYKVIGAVYVGVKQTELNILKEKFSSLKIGTTGMTYVIDCHQNEKGTLLIHPTLEGKNAYEAKDLDGRSYVKEMIENKNGKGVYRILDPKDNKVKRKMIYYRYLESMEWIIAAEIEEDEVYAPLKELRNRIVGWMMVCVVFVVGISIFMARSFSLIIQRIVEVLTFLEKGNFSKSLEEKDTTRGDEFGIMASHFNDILLNFKQLLKKTKETSEVIAQSIQDLTVSSKEISTTFSQQAAAVKEIVATMEDSGQVSKAIDSKMGEMAKIAVQTQQNVQSGFSLINNTMGKMEEIRQTNNKTIQGIKLVGEQISNIGEVVTIINRIADQTKIIAFNAELQASAAGEAGKNFQIVATEVRRLADSTVSSTGQIKQKIGEIQKAADNLMLASETGTERIKEGHDFSAHLQKVFQEILNSAEVSAGSAKEIDTLIKQQVAAFEEILLTLKQISSGINDFEFSARSTASSSEELRKISANLNEILMKYVV